LKMYLKLMITTTSEVNYIQKKMEALHSQGSCDLILKQSSLLFDLSTDSNNKEDFTPYNFKQYPKETTNKTKLALFDVNN
jgi:hypothetical protein